MTISDIYKETKSKVSKTPSPSSYCTSLGPPKYCFVQANVTKSKVSPPPPSSYCTSLGPPAYCFVQANVTKSKVSLPPPSSYCTSLDPPAYCHLAGIRDHSVHGLTSIPRKFLSGLSSPQLQNMANLETAR